VAQVSNPFSTGGGGDTFQFKVQAAFLLNMIIGGMLPSFGEAKAIKIMLQARIFGYNTDDIVVLLKDSDNVEYKMITQIKHSFSFIKSNENFSNVIMSAYEDFKGALFREGNDRIFIITKPLSKTDTDNIRTVFDWARSSLDSIEFYNKIYTTDFSSKRKQDIVSNIESVIFNNGQQDKDLLWRFVKSLYIASYDFDNMSSTDRSNVLSLIKLAKDPECTESIEGIWTKIIEYIADSNTQALQITIDSMKKDILKLFITKAIYNIIEDVFNQNTKLYLKTIRDDIKYSNGSLKISRDGYISEIIEKFNSNDITIITGNAGVGKSVIIKDVLTNILNTYILFIRAEEFNCNSLNKVLENIGIKGNAIEFFSKLMLLTNKVIFIDSGERLFELADRTSFLQLLVLIKDDPSIKLVIGCREYSYEHIMELILDKNKNIATCFIKNLTDKEMEKVFINIPELSEIKDNSNLYELLRNPFYLSEACKISWHSENVISIDESQFKNIIWNKIIMNNEYVHKGMNVKRGNLFTSICLAKAKRNSTYVSIDSVDIEVAHKLVSDNILICKEGNYAPAHDVLEDIALIKYVETKYIGKTNNSQFFESLGTDIAMRRSYRLWLFDNIDKVEKSDFIIKTLTTADIGQYWKDETMSAIILSDKADIFFETYKDDLLANDCILLKRFIHIARTACKKINEDLLKRLSIENDNPDISYSDVFLIPNGKGWVSLLRFICQNITSELKIPLLSIIGLLKDFQKTISIDKPLPDGSRECGLIAIHYIMNDIFGTREQSNIFIDIASMVTEVIQEEMVELIESSLIEKSCKTEFDYKEFLKQLISSLNCTFLCKQLPDHVIKIALHLWIAKVEKNTKVWYRPFEEENGIWGLNPNHGEFFPASGMQGPILFLFRYHPAKAIKFIIRLINYSTDKYAEYINKNSEYKPVEKLKITLNNGDIIEQWGNYTLWGLYTNNSTQSDLLTSALKALENWLYDIAEMRWDEKVIQSVFSQIMLESRSIALSAVLISFGNKYYDLLSDSLLPLMNIKEFYEWDFIRYDQSKHDYDNIVPHTYDKEIFYNDRKKAYKHSLENKYMENLILNLQFTSLEEKIYTILDNFYIKIPNEIERTDDDRRWIIALNRMDKRKCKFEKYDENYMAVIPGEIEQEDVKSMIKDELPLSNWNCINATILMTSANVFLNEDIPSNISWDELLEQGKYIYSNIQNFNKSPNFYDSYGYVYVACLGYKTFLNNITNEDKSWCRKVIVEFALKNKASISGEKQYTKNYLDPTRPLAFVLPLILSHSENKEKKKIKLLILDSIFNEIIEVQDYAAVGISRYLWKIDSKLAESIIRGLVIYSKWYMDTYIRARNTLDNKERLKYVKNISKKIKILVLHNLIPSVLLPKSISKQKYSLDEYVNALKIIPYDSNDMEHIKLYLNVINCLLDYIKNNEESDRYWITKLGTSFTTIFPRLFARFTLKHDIATASQLWEHLVENAINYPDFTNDFVERLISEEDAIFSNDVFWSVWEKLYYKVFSEAKFSDNLDRYFMKTDELVSNLLLDYKYWKENITEWRSFKGKGNFIRYAYETVGKYPLPFQSLARTTYKIGYEYLPGAFYLIEDVLKNGDPKILLNKEDTLYCMESILRKFFFTNEFLVRTDEKLNATYKYILDEMINVGSSVAYRLRDLVITPINQ